MLFKKIKYSVVFKAITIVLLQAFFVSSVAFAIDLPTIHTLATPLATKPMCRVVNGARAEIAFSAEDLKKIYRELNQSAQSQTLEAKLEDTGILEVLSCNQPDEPTELLWCLLEAFSNSYNAIVSRSIGKKKEKFAGVITIEILYEENDFVINVVDNGKTIDFNKDGTPSKRRKIASRHSGTKHHHFGMKYITRVTKWLNGTVDWYPLKNGTWTQIRIPRKNLPEGIKLDPQERIVILNRTDDIDWNKETRRIVLAEETYGKSFRNRTAFMYICEKLDKYLTLGITEHTTRKDIRDDIELARRAIDEIRKTVPQGELEQSRDRGGLDPILCGFELDELYYRGNAFYLPIYRDNEQGNRVKTYEYKFYKDGDEKTATWVIWGDDGEPVIYVDVVDEKYDIPEELTAKKQDTLSSLVEMGKKETLTEKEPSMSPQERIERTGVMLRRWTHQASTFSTAIFAGLTIKVDSLLVKKRTDFLEERLSEVGNTIRKALEVFGPAQVKGKNESREGLLTTEKAKEYIERFEEAIRFLKTARALTASCYSEFKEKYIGEDAEKELSAFEKLLERFDDIAIASIQSCAEIAKGSPSMDVNPIKPIIDMAKKSDVELNMHCSEDTLVRGNQKSLISAVNNIVSNAKDFARNKVIVTVEKGNDIVRISITDDGLGLPEGYCDHTGLNGRQKVFDLDNSTKGDKGTGLGTTEAYYAVIDAGGTIEVESELGKGTTFTIRLPVAPEEYGAVQITEEDSRDYNSSLGSLLAGTINRVSNAYFFIKGGNETLKIKLDEQKIKQAEMIACSSGFSSAHTRPCVKEEAEKLQEIVSQLTAFIEYLNAINEEAKNKINKAPVEDKWVLERLAKGIEAHIAVLKSVKTFFTPWLTELSKPASEESSGQAIRSPIEKYPISTDGFTEVLANIVVSKEYPAKNINLKDLLEYVKIKSPEILKGAKTSDEEMVLLCSAIANQVGSLFTIVAYDKLERVYHDGIDWGSFTRFGGRPVLDKKAKPTEEGQVYTEKNRAIHKLFEDATQMLNKLEHVVLASESHRAFLIAQYFGKGHKDAKKLPSGYKHQTDTVREFFEPCIYPERRKFVGQWERDYAGYLSHLSASEIQNEWRRIQKMCGQSQNALYNLSVREFHGDTIQFFHPSVFGGLDFDVLMEFTDEKVVTHTIIFMIAKASIYLEWAQRHWQPNLLDKTFASLPKKITPNLEGIKNAIGALRWDKERKTISSNAPEMPLEERPCYKILSNLIDLEAMSILQIPIPKPTPEAVTPITSESERIHAETLLDQMSLIEASKDKQLDFAAIDTDWITGYEKGVYLQYDALNPLITSYAKLCKKRKIPFILGDSETVIREVQALKQANPNAQGIVLGAEATIEKLGLDDDKNVFLAGVDNKHLTIDSYIRLMEMLSLTLELFRKGIIDEETIQKEHEHLGFKKIGPRRITFEPDAQPMDYESLRIIYAVQKFA